MPGNIYEVLATKNAKLAKFTDENPNIALAFKKIIGLVVAMSEAKKFPADKWTFEAYSPDDDIIVLRLKKPGQ